MASNSNVRKSVVLGILGTLLGLLLGVIAGYFIARIKPDSKEQSSNFHALNVDNWNDNPELAKYIIENIKPSNIRENLRECSKEPHLAGSARNKELAEYIKNKWLEYGFDSAELVPYNVLLSKPNPRKPNTVEIVGPSDEVYLSIVPLEPTLLDEDRSKSQEQPFHAYSPNGIVEGEVVYANYGDERDLQNLEENNINLTGKIILTRTVHGIYHVAKLASKRGIVGVLAFPHPNNYPALQNPEDQYPVSSGLPSNGIIHAAIRTGEMGDMQTPGIPSTVDAYRIPREKLELSTIPSQPISYNDFEQILKLLKGFDMPTNSSINFNNLPILGPGFKDPNHRKLRLSVYNQLMTLPIYNVIGTITGSIEPDRYVILGNHRDAWSYGGVDPCSGTAAMLELSRVYGEMMKTGWRPRRTLVFGSWAAEEMGLIGSTEWVEEKLPKLRDRAVSYINTDICVVGEKFFPLASPLLHEALLKVTKMISDPKGEEVSFYEAWLKQDIAFNDSDAVNTSETMENEPYIDPIGIVLTDHYPFMMTAIIPVMDINWRPTLLPNYPTYHTGYDTFHYMDKFIDPTFKFHRSCGQVAGLLLHYLADSKILPLSVKRFMKHLTHEFEVIVSNVESFFPEAKFIDRLKRAIKNYEEAVTTWYHNLKQIDGNDPLAVRRINNQMMQMEKAFSYLSPVSDLNMKAPVSRMQILSRTLSIAHFYRGQMSRTELLEKLEKIISQVTVLINYIIQSLQPFSKV